MNLDFNYLIGVLMI